jgi:hypothetical protein
MCSIERSAEVHDLGNSRQGSALRGHSKDGSCYIVLSFGGKDVYDA